MSASCARARSRAARASSSPVSSRARSISHRASRTCASAVSAAKPAGGSLLLTMTEQRAGALRSATIPGGSPAAGAFQPLEDGDMKLKLTTFNLENLFNRYAILDTPWEERDYEK